MTGDTEGTADLERRLRDAYTTLDPGPAPVTLRHRAARRVAVADLKPGRLPRTPLRLAQVAAALVASLVVGGSGILLAGALTAAPSASPTLASRTPGPTPHPNPTSATAPLPLGAQVVLTTAGLARLDWAPDGAHVAAITDASGELGVDVLDAAGRQVGSYAASATSWLDATHLITFQLVPDDPGPGTGTVTIHAIDSGPDQAIPGPWTGAMANRHGSIVLIDEVAGASQGDHLQVWQDGHLGPVISGHGSPVAWSADGRDLALETTGLTVERPGLVLANTGGPLPATVQVLRFPGAVPIALSSSAAVDERSALFFSPDGRWLAGDGADQQGPVVFDLTAGAAGRVPIVGRPIGWTPDGRLVIDHFDGTARLWWSDGSLTDPGFTGLPVYGPTMDDVALVPGLQDLAGSIAVRSASGAVSISTSVWGEDAPVSWAPDGRSLYLTIPGTVHGIPTDQLVRVLTP